MSYTSTQAANALNETLSKLGYEYQIDTTNDTSIQQGFQTVGAFPAQMRSCILDMQMKILQTRAFSTMFDESKNPTRRFWRSAVDYGGGIQDIFVKLIEAEPGFWASDFCAENNYGGYGSEEALAQAIAQDLVSYKKDDIVSKIHVVTDKFRIKMSISDLEYSKLFTPQGYGDFITTKYTNFQNSVEANLMKITIKVIQNMVSAGHVIFNEGLSLNTPNEVTNTVEQINTVSDGMQGLTSLYNYDQVENITDFDDLYLVVTPSFWNRIKSRGYSNAFNLDEYKVKNRLIMLPAGTSLGTNSAGQEVGAILLDYRAVTIAIRYWEVGAFIVSNTDFRNSFNKIQLITGYTEFFNAVAFVTGEVGAFSSSDDYVLFTIAEGTIDSLDIKVNGKPYLSKQHESGENYFAQYPKNSFVEASTNGQTFVLTIGNTSTQFIDSIDFYLSDNADIRV